MPLFVSLSNVSRILDNVSEYDLSNIIALPNAVDQQLLEINLYPFCNYNMFDDNITWSKTLLKHVAEKSSRQLNDSPGASDRYNIYNFNEIKSAVDKIAERVNKTLVVMKKLLPFEKMEPSSIEYSKWIAQLRNLRSNTSSFFVKELVSLD